MPGTWWTRLVLIVAILLWGAWNLAPTVLLDEDVAQQNLDAITGAAAAGDGAEPERPWTDALISSARISPGIDIAGGVDLTLEIDVDEAVASSVQRDVKPLMDAAEKDGLGLSEVRRARGEPTLLIRPKDGVGLGEVTGFIEKRYGTYAYENTRTVDGADWFAFRVTDEQATYVRQRAVEQALETLRSRIDETGVKEPSIVLKGGNRINVQLPGLEDPKSAVDAIGTTAQLQFYMVDEEAMKDPAALERALLRAESELPLAERMDDRALSDWLVAQALIPKGDRLLWEYIDGPDGRPARDPDPGARYLVKDEVILTGDDVNNARTAWNQYNEPYVSLEFKPRGGNIFAKVTEENVGRRFAIVLDHRVSSAPYIREAIRGGQASIEMGEGDMQYQQRAASTLALVLRTGALPAPVTVTGIRVVGPSLGRDAIAEALIATSVGAVLVVTFMIAYYKRSGAVAVVALSSNVMLVLALLAVAGATLTLPGVTGIALTIGMAVDCNIVIFERIREELRLGRNARAAVDTGFDKALWAVLDSNITTFIAGVVLYTYGTGPIKGFAVTLMIGIVTTLFTGVFLSRTLMELLTRRAAARLSI
jgi:SecD/SecF fusion protein